MVATADSNFLIICVEMPIDIEGVILCQFIFPGANNKPLQLGDFMAERRNNIGQARLIPQFNLHLMLTGYFVR
jgi:hypothetical protein